MQLVRVYERNFTVLPNKQASKILSCYNGKKDGKAILPTRSVNGVYHFVLGVNAGRLSIRDDRNNELYILQNNEIMLEFRPTENGWEAMSYEISDINNGCTA